MLDWIKKEPIRASLIVKIVLIVAGILMHKYGVEMPMDLKLAIDALLGTVFLGSSEVARKSVVPTAKMTEAEIETVKDRTPAEAKALEP